MAKCRHEMLIPPPGEAAIGSCTKCGDQRPMSNIPDVDIPFKTRRRGDKWRMENERHFAVAAQIGGE